MAETIRLDRPPALAPLLARAAARAVPGFGDGGGDGLPDVEVRVEGVAVDAAHVAAYARVCGHRLGDELPPTYLHLLGFPLSVLLMTRPDFPFGLLGMVHVRNTVTWDRPVRLDDVVDLSATVTNLRPHPKGRQMDNVVTVEVAGRRVWRSVSTYLKRGGGEDSHAGEAIHPADEVDVAGLPLTAVWRVPADIGRRYAAVSGDRNPIHLTGLTAKAFGFQRAIAHGMWTKARALAGLEGRLPAAGTVDVAFKAPLLLPATVQYATAPLDGGWAFGVRSHDGRPHLAGVVSPTG